MEYTEKQWDREIGWGKLPDEYATDRVLKERAEEKKAQKKKDIDKKKESMYK